MTADKPTPVVPNLRFPEFRDGPDWSTSRGDALFSPINNRKAEPGLPVLAITQEHGAIPRDEINYHVSVTAKSVANYKEVCEGDFIISLRSFQGGIEYSQFHGICSPAYVILRRKGDGSDHFFRHLFKSDRFIQQLTRNIEGLRDGKMISYVQFSEQLLPVPEPPEQQKIADCLGSLDDLIAAENLKLEALRQHKQGLMQQLFPQPGETVPILRFPDSDDGTEWQYKVLPEIATNLNNMRIPVTEQDRIPGDVPYYGASGIVDYVKDHIFDEDLLCVSEDGANLVARSSPIAFSISGRTWVNNHAHVLRFQQNVTQILVQAYLNHIDISGYITGVAQPKLNRAMLDSIPIALPPMPDEQNDVAGCIASFDHLLSMHQKKIESLSVHKKGLLLQLFPSLESR